MKKLSQAPIQYQKGYCEFYKLKFHLTRDVLIPRPETELLVDEVIKIVRGSSFIVDRKKESMNNEQLAINKISILDIGTGSGAIAIAIAKNCKAAKIIATDISKEALKVAEKNATFHKVNKQIVFIESDLLGFIQPSSVIARPRSGVAIPLTNLQENKIATSSTPPRNDANKIDIIVANLPYIPTARLMYIDPMVTDWEPNIALDGGKDGFELYRTLFSQMKEKNIIPKYLIAELDYTHEEIAKSEAYKFFPEAEVEVKLDLAKKVRILVINFQLQT